MGILITELGNARRLKGIVDRVYGIDRGEIIYKGTLEGILINEKAKKRIWGI